jgi:hypothetical protein
MNLARLLALGPAVLIVGCSADSGTLDPTWPALSAQSGALERATPARQVQTSGHFDAIVDFSTLTLTPTGRNCRLTVRGQLVFSGTIQGIANGETSALVFAPCSEVASNPPGTFPDVFKSEAVFEGTIAGQPVHSNLLYMGRSEPGGHISGRFVFSRGVEGRLDVDSQLAVGGQYQGMVVVN